MFIPVSLCIRTPTHLKQNRVLTKLDRTTQGPKQLPHYLHYLES